MQMPLEIQEPTQPHPHPHAIFRAPEDPAATLAHAQPQLVVAQLGWPGQRQGIPLQTVPAIPVVFAAGGGGMTIPAATTQHVQPQNSWEDALEELEAAGRDKLAKSLEKTRQAA